MYRKALYDLIDWKDRPSRKPLIIRGARQVGKTWLVRKFADQFDNLVEINFDKNPEKAQLFAGKDISRWPRKLRRIQIPVYRSANRLFNWLKTLTWMVFNNWRMHEMQANNSDYWIAIVFAYLRLGKCKSSPY